MIDYSKYYDGHNGVLWDVICLASYQKREKSDCEKKNFSKWPLDGSFGLALLLKLGIHILTGSLMNRNLVKMQLLQLLHKILKKHFEMNDLTGSRAARKKVHTSI